MAGYMKRFNISISQFPDAHIVVRRGQNGEGIWSRDIGFELCLNEGWVIPSDAMLLLESLEGVKKQLSSDDEFDSDEFFQGTFVSQHKGLKLGHAIQDFIIVTKSHFPFNIANIYSTNDEIDSLRSPKLKISELAIKFWTNRVNLNKADYSSEFGRYFIKWD